MSLNPPHHHLDARADKIADAAPGTGPDHLLSTIDVAQWFGISVQWLEIGRSSGNYGPPFVRIGTRIRYRRGDVVEWLRARTQATGKSAREVA